MIANVLRACRTLAASLVLVAGAALAHPADPTEGGKGGRIIRVTTLAKDGPGSLAEAVAAKGKRIIVFEVGGAIDLQRSVLDIKEPYVTIAGQTAPSPGITLIRGGIDVHGHDVKISNLRVLTGVDHQPRLSGWEADAFSTVGAYNVVIENNTFLWALDETCPPRVRASMARRWPNGARTLPTTSFSA